MTAAERQTINQISRKIKHDSTNESSGHDWWHIYRVWQTAIKIAKEEKADLFITELAALLHDVADWKFHNGDESIGPTTAKRILVSYAVSSDSIERIVDIITNLSFKGALVPNTITSLEGKVVQDADRLDAIGAIGIARTFAYGGFAGHALHIPGQKPVMHQSKKDYFLSQGSSINHFYEKLLLLKDRMNTNAGKRLARARHRFLEKYLQQFYNEWDGRC